MKYPLFVDIDHTANYKTYRPTYPEKLYLSILEYYFDTTNHDIVNEGTKIPLALDVACGNGQATVDLSNYCQKIIGIDASQTQLDNAVRKDNIEYLCHNAEDLTFIESNTIDLITVATALHWFNIEEFFSQAKRILKPNHGVIAIWTYGIGTLNNPDATKLVCQFDEVDLADYWSDKRKLIDENYSSVLHLFPYEETRVKHVINCEKELSIRHYIKFLETWSASQTYKEKNGETKFNEVLEKLANNIVECYRDKNVNNGNDNDIYDTKIIITFPITLFLMRKT